MRRNRGPARWAAAGLALAAIVGGLVASAGTTGATQPTPAFGGPGRFAVTTSLVVGPDGGRYQVVRPASYRALGFLSPVVTWGNGTGGSPGDYTTLLDHLASWGFTVVASTLPNTGSGVNLVDGVRQLDAADGRSGSVFFHRLDLHEVAAVGHSQGATGAVRAAELAPSTISTVVTFSLPWNGQGPVGTHWDGSSLGWSLPNADCPVARDCWPDPTRLHQPTLFLATRGPIDSIIANPVVERCYFEEAHGPAALGLVSRSGSAVADHLSIQDPDHGGSPGGLLDAVTAWLLAQLRDDRAAARVFAPHGPSFLGSANWAGSAVKTRWTGAAGCA